MPCSERAVFRNRASQICPITGKKAKADNARLRTAGEVSPDKQAQGLQPNRAARSQPDYARLPLDDRAGGPVRPPTR